MKRITTIGILAVNCAIAAGIGYAVFEAKKQVSDTTEAVEQLAEERANEIAEEHAIELAYQAEQVKQVQCLATNIYYETMASSLADAMAVTDVVLNRVAHEKYPSTPCEVVHQSYLNDKGVPLLNKCQFSWYCDGKADEPQNENSWTKSVDHAVAMYSGGDWRGLTEGSTHYHATYVSPSWAKEFTKIVQIGAHIFYRMEDK
tara:strand:+ start:4826 stop:5431 length:606 start_codon:yes stop_codon:yes gene_type:complete